MGWGLAVLQLRQGLGQELGGSLGTSWLSVLVLSQEAAPLRPGDSPPRAQTSSVIRMVHKPGR